VPLQRFLDEESLHLLEAHVVQLPRRIGAPTLEAEVGLVDLAAPRHEDRALHRVVELPDVARPGVGGERSYRVRVEAGPVLAVALGVQAQEVTGEEGNVLSPFPERRHLDLDRVEAEEEVLPEAAARYLLPYVRVRGGEDPDVGPPGTGRPHPLELSRLQHPQKLRLEVERHVRDLVEEERPPVRHLEAAHAVGLGVGEGALHVAEELALEDALGEPARVHGEERLRRAGGHGVERGRHRALPGPVLARDQHVRVRGAHPPDHLEHGAHRLGLRDEQRPPLVAQRPVLGLEPLPATESTRQLGLRAQGGDEPGVLPRLLHEVAGPATHRRNRDVDAPPRRHHHHGEGGVDRLELRQQVHALAAGGRVAGVVEVHEDDVDLPRFDGGEHGGRRVGRLEEEALRLEQEAQRLEDVGLIVGGEDARREPAHGNSQSYSPPSLPVPRLCSFPSATS
jgi:hypothetical protein